MTGLAAACFGWPRQWIPAYLRRRLTAAALAAAAVVLALASLHSAAPTVPTPPAGDPAPAWARALRAGQVAAPVRLADPGVAPLLRPGVTVDVLAAVAPALVADGTSSSAPAQASVIARGVRVLGVPAGEAHDTAGGTLVVLGVSRSEAQTLAAAETAGRLSVALVSG